jgi:hypothetical protein
MLDQARVVPAHQMPLHAPDQIVHQRHRPGGPSGAGNRPRRRLVRRSCDGSRPAPGPRARAGNSPPARADRPAQPLHQHRRQARASSSRRRWVVRARVPRPGRCVRGVRHRNRPSCAHELPGLLEGLGIAGAAQDRAFTASDTQAGETLRPLRRRRAPVPRPRCTTRSMKLARRVTPVEEETRVGTGQTQHGRLERTHLQPHRHRNAFVLAELVEHQRARPPRPAGGRSAGCCSRQHRPGSSMSWARPATSPADDRQRLAPGAGTSVLPSSVLQGHQRRRHGVDEVLAATGPPWLGSTPSSAAACPGSAWCGRPRSATCGARAAARQPGARCS